jgi:hypothetical protein
MNSKELAALIDGIIPALKEYIDGEIGAIRRRLDENEKGVELKTPAIFGKGAK